MKEKWNRSNSLARWFLPFATQPGFHLEPSHSGPLWSCPRVTRFLPEGHRWPHCQASWGLAHLFLQAQVLRPDCVSCRPEAASPRQLSLISPNFRALGTLEKEARLPGGIGIILLVHYCSCTILRTGLCRIELVPAMSRGWVGFSGTGLLKAFDIYPL